MIVETIEFVRQRYGLFLKWFEIVSVAVFTLEYIGRVWSCVSSNEFQGTVRGRLKFMRGSMAIIDFLAIAPFYLPFLGVDLRFVRVLRLLRVVRVAKIGRYYSSLKLISRVLSEKKEELVLTTAIMMLLLVFASSAMYYCEAQAQPEALPNIPAAFWWSVVTLTTVGYGDISPVTTIGKLVGAVIAILGIGMFALPCTFGKRA